MPMAAVAGEGNGGGGRRPGWNQFTFPPGHYLEGVSFDPDDSMEKDEDGMIEIGDAWDEPQFTLFGKMASRTKQSPALAELERYMRWQADPSTAEAARLMVAGAKLPPADAVQQQRQQEYNELVRRYFTGRSDFEGHAYGHLHALVGHANDLGDYHEEHLPGGQVRALIAHGPSEEVTIGRRVYGPPTLQDVLLDPDNHGANSLQRRQMRRAHLNNVPWNRNDVVTEQDFLNIGQQGPDREGLETVHRSAREGAFQHADLIGRGVYQLINTVGRQRMNMDVPPNVMELIQDFYIGPREKDRASASGNIMFKRGNLKRIRQPHKASGFGNS